ncbi:MAG: LacI family DNA-binding transcriptional regulator [Victivallales bacterium]|nr:LacI family DNA-binding transcriptional regulator [Victivallales bacterium]
MVTLKDIARDCGVSVSVVSRALNPQPDQQVAPKTKRRVEESMRRLGYHPNVSASLLARGRSAEVGVFLQRLRESLVAELAIGISEAAEQHDFHYRFFFNERDDAYAHFIDSVATTGCSGILTYPVTSGCQEVYDALERYSEKGGQVVLLNANYKPHSPRIDLYLLDDEGGGELAAEHLLSCGCRQFRMCLPAYKSLYNSRRQRGYLRRLKAAGYTVECYPIHASGFHIYDVNELDAALPPPSTQPIGLFTPNDYLALSLMQRLVAAGRLGEVGRTIRLVGFDDNPAAACACLPLTTIRHDLHHFGQSAMRVLIGKILGRQEKMVFNRPTLIVRAT